MQVPSEDDAPAEAPSQGEGRVLQVHVGRSANCSSVGSVVDFLFLSAVAGSAVLAAVGVALAGGERRASGKPPSDAEPAESTDLRDRDDGADADDGASDTFEPGSNR